MTPQVNWQPCTIKEATSSQSRSEYWDAVSGEWLSCIGVFLWSNTPCRSRAVLHDWVDVTESVFCSLPDSVQKTHFIGPRDSFRVLRSSVEIGTVLG